MNEYIIDYVDICNWGGVDWVDARTITNDGGIHLD
jgi:hypothetical protein